MDQPLTDVGIGSAFVLGTVFGVVLVLRVVKAVLRMTAPDSDADTGPDS